MTGNLKLVLLSFLPFSVMLSASASESMNFYSSGTLKNASSLPQEGDGFYKLFLPRDRAYGTEELVFTIESVASKFKNMHPESERIQIGDLGAKEGGKITLHASHQNGLDADLSYMRKNKYEQSPHHTRGFEENFVDQQKKEVTENFSVEKNYDLLMLFAETGNVQRIFLDPVIKKTMCEHAYVLGEWEKRIEHLRILRPLSNHAGHFHVRLFCPEGDQECIPQTATDAGSGCEEVGFIPPSTFWIQKSIKYDPKSTSDRHRC